METNQFQQSYSEQNQVSVSKTFMSGVFSWMFGALIISAATAYLFAQSAELLQILVNFETGKLTLMGWVVMLAPIGFVMLMSFAFNKLSYTALMLLFIAYSAINGMSLSFIFLAYNLGTIYVTFVVTAATFGIMAFVGYRTNTDLTQMGSILKMGLLGIIIASVINMFLKSDTMDYIISFIGVIVFTGLTAYDVQKLKRIGSGIEFNGHESASKLTIIGALTLYLDFIGLFLMLLRLFGRRD